jgi:hypothetical protein
MSSVQVSQLHGIRWRAVWVCGLISFMGSGCGVVGSPVAPEYVGVAPTIERQKKQHATEVQGKETGMAAGSVQEPEPLPQEDLELPPLRPVGTR